MKATREQFTVPNAPEQRHPETGLAPLFVNDGELVLTSLEGEVAQEIKIHDQQNGVLALVGSSPQGDFKATRLFGSMLSRSLGDELTHALENISQSRATPRALPALLEQHVKNALMVARARADDLFDLQRIAGGFGEQPIKSALQKSVKISLVAIVVQV